LTLSIFYPENFFPKKMRTPAILTSSFMVIASLVACGPSGTDSGKTESAPKAADNSVLIAQGKSLYPTCATCHGQGAEGMKALNAPAIAHQEDWYLERQINHFRADFRGAHEKDTYGAQMAPMAKTLANEQAVKAVVAYIRTLPPKSPEATVEGDAANGKNHYNMICAACHGNRAQGNEALNSPKLLGTDDWYLLRQTVNFMKDIRGTHPKDTYGSQMHTIAKGIPDEQTARDVVAYIQSLTEAAE
jgi:cbb3-type cytochrome c oxidase subunit III